jgi:hypothetical protein
MVLANVMPGFRELRAPLAAGYLWLVWAWLVWGDTLPTRKEVTGPLDRLYELEPVVSDLGRAVIASVAAYIVGSIAIDLETRFGRLNERFGSVIPIARPIAVTDAGNAIVKRMLVQALGGPDVPHGAIRTAHRWILDNRQLLKTRLLDLSTALHSEVDRPDAEATFRMALWPPLAAIAIYLAVSVSPLWLLALILPAFLAVQWISLRRQANDTLITAVAARSELETLFLEQTAGVVDTLGGSRRLMTPEEREAARAVAPHPSQGQTDGP